MQVAGIIHTDKNGGYSAAFPDFLGCVTAGDSLQETYELAKEALAFHIEGMLADGLPMPVTMHTLDEAKQHPFAKGAEAFFMTEIAPPSRSIRLNITMDEQLVRRIDATASNRSAFLAEAARRMIESGSGNYA